LEEETLMFFILSKTVAFLLLPSNLLIIIGIVGIALLALRRARAGICLVVASIGLLVASGLLPVGTILLHGLESRFPPWDARRGAPDGIVVLGNAISPRLSRSFGEPVTGGSGSRLLALARLAFAFPGARIVYSGGDPSLFGKTGRETDFVYPLLDGLGVSRDRVLLETRSRNTAENAAFTKELVGPKPGERWLLVTSALHMPRAIGCFRKAGFPVEAYPVGWRTTREFDWIGTRSLAYGLARVDAAAYEWIGLVAYWLTGRTTQLFPSP